MVVPYERRSDMFTENYRKPFNELILMPGCYWKDSYA